MFPLRFETDRLILREFEEGDWVHTNVYDSDPEVVRYLTNGVLTLDESEAYVRRVMADARAVPRKIFDLAVIRREDQQLIGKVGFGLKDDRTAAIWFVFRRDCQGRGYGTEAVRPMIDYAFGELGLHRIFGDCDPLNTASAALMKKLGLRQEAHFVKDVFIKGEWVDTAIFAMLDEEWRERTRSRGAS